MWNTGRGLNQTPSALAWAERERAALFRRMVEFFQKYDLLVTPGAPTAAFDVNLRHPETIGGKKPENYMAGSTVNSVITLTMPPRHTATARTHLMSAFAIGRYFVIWGKSICRPRCALILPVRGRLRSGVILN